MKYTLITFLSFFLFHTATAQNGQQVSLKKYSDSLVVAFNDKTTNLGDVEILPLPGNNGKPVRYRFLKFNEHDTFFAVLTTHPYFANKAVLHIFEWHNKDLMPLFFYYDGTEHFNDLIALDYHLYIDEKNNIYVHSSNTANKNIMIYKVDKYVWNERMHQVVYQKSKTFLNMSKEISKMQF